MNRKTLVRLGLALLTCAFLAGCSEPPTAPEDEGGGDTTGTGKNVVERVLGALS
ncbi:MAG: hypothetical protein V1907_01005 [Candidatus Kerfeldbacteria bacterium]